MLASTLIEFVRVLVERRASSVEIQAKYLQSSATLHLSGTVHIIGLLKYGAYSLYVSKGMCIAIKVRKQVVSK